MTDTWSFIHLKEERLCNTVMWPHWMTFTWRNATISRARQLKRLLPVWQPPNHDIAQLNHHYPLRKVLVVQSPYFALVWILFFGREATECLSCWSRPSLLRTTKWWSWMCMWSPLWGPESWARRNRRVGAVHTAASEDTHEHCTQGVCVGVCALNRSSVGNAS